MSRNIRLINGFIWSWRSDVHQLWTWSFHYQNPLEWTSAFGFWIPIGQSSSLQNFLFWWFSLVNWYLHGKLTGIEIRKCTTYIVQHLTLYTICNGGSQGLPSKIRTPSLRLTCLSRYLFVKYRLQNRFATLYPKMPAISFPLLAQE